MNAKLIDLSVVLPIYNEEENIGPLLDEISASLKKINLRSEILAIDDGSKDATYEKLVSAKKIYPNLRILRFKKNHGLTSALDAGFKNATGEIIIICDADMQNDPADFPLLLSKMDTNDVVCGWRKNRKDTFVKKMSSKIANFVRNMVTDEAVHDTCCGLKAFRKQCVVDLKMFNGLHRFLPTLLKMEGYRVTEVVVNHRHRAKGKSKYNISNRVFKSLYDLIAVRWMKTRRLSYKEDIING